MGKKIKKGVKGEVTQFITRTKAIRKLQLSLKDFRRLCILKGVYPREPKKKFEGNSKTYYHVKDVNYLAHEKILQTFRNIKTHMKKYKKALHRDDKDKAQRIMQSMPKYALNHLVKERYPTFADAIKDLDDPLCLVNLFSIVQAHKLHNIPNEKIQTCLRLAREFNYYVIKSQSLRKVFLSIKGIYYQAEIQGHIVNWVTPYYFTQTMPMDVDYKIMMTFLEFYETMLKFVNFKLFQSVNLVYPPKVITEVETTTDQFTYKGLDAKKIESNLTEKIAEEKYQISAEFNDNEDVKKINEKSHDTNVNLFKGLTFCCSREVPRYSLEFVILSFAGKVTWETDPDYNASKVTHVITDRDPKFVKIEKNKEYIQPQWVYDSVNSKVLLPVKDYAPGKPLPPHLSPFLSVKDDVYKPERAIEIEKLKGGEGEVLEEEKEEEDADDGMEEEYDAEEEVKKAKKQQKKEQLENVELGKLAMSRKKQKLLEKATFAKKKEQDKAVKLKEKKEKLRKMNKEGK
jgi:pescadillo protein